MSLHAPNFDTQDLMPYEGWKCGYGNFIIQPIGERLLFPGHNLNMASQAGGYPEFSDLWAMEVNGDNPRVILDNVISGETGIKNLELLYWADETRLVYFGYQGMGRISLAEYNANTGTSLYLMDVRGEVFDTNGKYIPIMRSFDSPPPPPGRIGQITPGFYVFDLEKRRNNYHNDNSLFKSIPLPDEYLGMEYEVVMVDWRPGTNELLAIIKNTKDQQSAGDLIWWNVDTAEVSIYKRHVEYVQYSPDGKTLGYVTIKGDSKYKYTVWFEEAVPDWGFGGIGPTVILDQYDELIDTYSPPSHPAWRVDVQPFQIFNFSPDGQYVSFMSNNSGNPWTLLVRYVKSGHTVFKEEGASLPIWSPQSDRFIIRGRDKNLKIIGLNPITVTSITEEAYLHMWASWSFDGEYILLTSENKSGSQKYTNTIIKAP